MEPRPRILLVDDEQNLISTLQPALERAGFQVAVAMDGEEALHKVASIEPDLVILDILMPKINGREVLRQLRRAGNWVFVLMLTQVTGADERTMALEEGADDYLNKPFDAGELIARIHAIQRRARPAGGVRSLARKLGCENLVLDRQLHRVYLGRKELPLSAKAVAILECLMLCPGKLVAYEQLLEEVWGNNAIVGPNTLYVRINELRRALKDDAGHPRFIETVAGQGYRFVGLVKAL